MCGIAEGLLSVCFDVNKHPRVTLLSTQTTSFTKNSCTHTFFQNKPLISAAKLVTQTLKRLMLFHSGLSDLFVSKHFAPKGWKQARLLSTKYFDVVILKVCVNMSAVTGDDLLKRSLQFEHP